VFEKAGADSEDGTPQGGVISAAAGQHLPSLRPDLWFERVFRKGCTARPGLFGTRTTSWRALPRRPMRNGSGWT